MSAFYRRPRFWLVAACVAVGLLILQQVWHWEVERVEVQKGEFLVRIHKWGTDLPEGEILAPNDTYKGVMLEVLPEGRHFLNPLLWSYETQKMVNVQPGKCLVLMRKFGDRIPRERLEAGEILAREGEQGVLREVLKPGSYRLNSYAYAWEIVDAVEIRAQEVGVRTLKVGLDPRGLAPDAKRGAYVVPDGYRGVQQTTVAPGTYYINPYVESITPVEVRSHRVELTDIEFPSRDGFPMTPHVVVEYAVDPRMAPELLVRLADDGLLHQRDASPQEQAINEILQKVILPHIRGYARIEGSNFDARDFILVGANTGSAEAVNAREALQKALLDKVKPRSEELGVQIRAVTLADLRPPAELSDQISQREIARVEREKNIVRMGQYKAQQELMAKESLKQQATEKVSAETRLIQGKTKAEQFKQVEESRLKQELSNAQLQLEAAQRQAEATLAKGKAEANVINLQNEAEVAGLRTAVEGFGGAQHFAQYHIVSRLSPALSEIFASDQSDFAKLFAQFLTPAAAKPKDQNGTAPVRTATSGGAANSTNNP